MTPMDVLSGVGYALDTPGALLRGGIGNIGDLISGQDRTGWRASGREMLEAIGALGANQTGLDAGDVAGFLAEVLLDPLNLVPFGAAYKGGKRLATLAEKAGPRWTHAAAPIDKLDEMKEILGVDADVLSSFIPPGSRHIGRGAEAYVVGTPNQRALRFATDIEGLSDLTPRVAAEPLLQPSHTVQLPYPANESWPRAILDNTPVISPLDQAIERAIASRSRSFLSGAMPDIRADSIARRAEKRERVAREIAGLKAEWDEAAPGNRSAMSPWQPRPREPMPTELLDDPLFVQSNVYADIIAQDARRQGVSILQNLRNRASRSGFTWNDYGTSNAGLMGSQPVIMDPGFIQNTAGLPLVASHEYQPIGQAAGRLADALGYTGMVRNQWEGLPWRDPTLRNALLAAPSAGFLNALHGQY